MNKKLLIFTIFLFTISLIGCSFDSNDVIGEHSDTFTPMYVNNEASNIADNSNNNESNNTNENTDTENNNTSNSENNTSNSENNNTSNTENTNTEKMDMSCLDGIEQSTETVFERNKKDNSENTFSDNEELVDTFNLHGTIPEVSVVNAISAIAKKDVYSNVEVVVAPDDRNTDVYDYIVRFDTYDYYIITYYFGEGAVYSHDDTGYFASIYGEDYYEPDIEIEDTE